MNAPAATALDEPVRAALDGPHAHLATRHGSAVRYHPDVAPFLAPPRDSDEWVDAGALAGPDGVLVVRAPVPLDPPPGWEIVQQLPGVQLVLDDDVPTPADDTLDRLGAADVDAMLDLVRRTEPGPFARRTHELGTYLGVHDERAGLIAMAGERLRVPGATEISAVCTDPGARGRGLASRLVLAVAAGIRARDELPFLHAAATNTTAIRLYEQLGFRLRATPSFIAVRATAVSREPTDPPSEEAPS